MISMCETYELWMNEFCTIFIINSSNAKFVMYGIFLHQIWYLKFYLFKSLLLLIEKCELVWIISIYLPKQKTFCL